MAPRRRQVKKKNTNGLSFGSAWMWFFSGLLSGLVLATLALYQDWIKTPTSLEIIDEHLAAEQGAGIAEADDTLNTPQQYDFFEILQEPVDPIDVTELRRAAAQQNSSATTNSNSINTDSNDTSSYLLQIASFRSASDAETLKAELGLLGMSVNIVQAEIQGNTWHRVRIGPLDDAGQADSIHQRLLEAGYQVQIYRQ